MKLTKARIDKAFLKDNQTRKKFKNKKVLTHTNTYKNKLTSQPKILKNKTLKSIINL
jgi:hypothetical protein